jgi:hypothetical protein
MVLSRIQCKRKLFFLPHKMCHQNKYRSIRLCREEIILSRGARAGMWRRAFSQFPFSGKVAISYLLAPSDKFAQQQTSSRRHITTDITVSFVCRKVIFLLRSRLPLSGLTKLSLQQQSQHPNSSHCPAFLSAAGPTPASMAAKI